MNDESPEPHDESKEMAEKLIDAATSEGSSVEDDGLTKREREIERRVEEERKKKGTAALRRLKERKMGVLNYRWPAIILAGAGVLSIWSEFLVVMVHPAGIGFDTFLQAYLEHGSIFFVFPIISGVFLFMCAFWAYEDPRGAFLSIIPAMMMAMSGMTVYYLVSFALAANPNVGVSATGAPFTMILAAVLCLLAIVMRERE
ncbi:MAG: hypothetical protein ACTSYL_07800 [Candidatus Thorarchaeota archaeon]